MVLQTMQWLISASTTNIQVLKFWYQLDAASCFGVPNCVIDLDAV